MNRESYGNFTKILKSELIPAMGCTEPIAIALAAAKAREILGHMPQRIIAHCSANIIKNVKSVVVPNSGGRHGIEAAAILGAVAGNADLDLEVISNTTSQDIEEMDHMLKQKICTCKLAEGKENLYVMISAFYENESASVEIQNKHNHISKMTKNGEVLFEQNVPLISKSGDKSKLNLRDIYDYATNVNIEDIQQILENQISFNSRISKEGLIHSWGANVGKTLLEMTRDKNDLQKKAAAAAAAGSDARMNGCALPVVINSGSGNQGITACMPVMIYAEFLNSPHEKLLRALALSNLVSIHQKRFIGNLSAYCGAVSAATGAACGIAYLNDADYECIGRTIINSIATTGGIICDGAKSSCAAKIAASVEASITGYEMAKKGRVFQPGEGIVGQNFEQTIQNIGCVGKDGMKETDLTILRLMIA